MRNTLKLSLAAVAALAASGAAYAQAERAPAERPELTRAQVEARTAGAFARMDLNSDGVLNQTDREAREKAAFDRIDANHDGALSFAEFSAMRDERQAARGDSGEQRADRRVPGGPGLMMGGRGPGMARGADADRDGSVTRAEFTGAALARFDRADADRDGKISGDERRGMRRFGPGFERGPGGGARPAPRAG